MARCSIVPALDALTPRTSAISALESSAWYLSAISSRSRAASLPSARAHGVALRGQLGRLVGAGLARRARELGGRGALAAAQLVERGVAGDAEQPRARRSAAGVEARAPLVGALERLGGDVLGRGVVPEERRGVGEDVVPRVAVERVEIERACRGRGKGSGAGRRHILTTIAHGIHHRSALDSLARMMRSALLAVLVAVPAVPGGRVRAQEGRRRRGRPSTSATRPSSRTRSASAPRCPARRRARGSRCASASSTAPPTARGRTSRTPTPAGAWSGPRRAPPVESGWSFNFAKPAKAVTLRGVVRFRWRRGDTLPRQAEVATEAGHRSSAGADPADYSAATCVLSA